MLVSPTAMLLNLLLAAAQASGALDARSQASIVITVSVAPRSWVAEDGSICSNVAPTRFGLRDEDGRSYPALAADARCGAAAASRLDLKAEPGQLLMIVAE